MQGPSQLSRGRFRGFRRLLLINLVVAAVATSDLFAGASNPFAPAVGPGDIDLAHCASFLNGKPAKATVKVVHHVLGIRADRHGRWQAVPRDHRDPATIAYRLTLSSPISPGTILVDTWGHASGRVLAYLKSDQQYPGDPSKPAAWVTVNPQRPNGKYYVFPPDVKTRALLYTQIDAKRRPCLNAMKILKARLFDVTYQAVGQGERNPGGDPPGNLSKGWTWKCSAPSRENGAGRLPINAESPSWASLVWPNPQQLIALHLESNISKLQLLALSSEAKGNPAILERKHWSNVPFKRSGANVLFKSPVTTRAIKLMIREVIKDRSNPQGTYAQIDRIRSLRDLSNKPIPKARQTASHPPCALPYNLPFEGEMAMVVNDEQGIRQSNLFAQKKVGAGSGQAYWDLKDLNGHFVKPGRYTWKAIVAPYPTPPIHYQGTVMPNVQTHAPHNTPWHSGIAGGWLADHSVNSCVTVRGNEIFLGAFCAEAGHPLIRVDENGAKNWHFRGFGAFKGPHRLASDGKNVYCHSPGNGDRIYRIEPKDKRPGTVAYHFKPDLKRRGKLKGLAARDGKLYMAFRVGGPQWLQNAVEDRDVDFDKSVPYQQPHVKVDEGTPQPRQCIKRLYRLSGSPPGQDRWYTYLDSTKSGGRRQFIVLALNKEKPIGTLVLSPVPQKDVFVKVSVLKRGLKKWREKNEDHWKTVGQVNSLPWQVITMPEGTVTAAVRFSFSKGGSGKDDIMDMIDSDDADEDDLGLTEGGGAKLDLGKRGTWFASLEGVKLLKRRYAGLHTKARFRVNAGKVGKGGVWDAQRTEPLVPTDPGIYVQEWNQPQEVRGLAIKEIDGAVTEIDCYEGPETGAIDIKGTKHWRKVAEYKQKRRFFYQPSTENNAEARYIDGYVDFGKSIRTRAVRLRIIRQWRDNQSRRPWGIRSDRGGLSLDQARCRIFGVAPLKYLGKPEPKPPLAQSDRLEVYDLASKKIVNEHPVKLDGPLRFDPQGNLYARAENKIVRVDPETGATTDVVTDLKVSCTFCFDLKGNLLAFDSDKQRMVIRVYDPQGKYLRDIGTPGGQVVGPWDPSRLFHLIDMAVDNKGQIWAVERGGRPKRVVQFGPDGSFRREFTGNTPYGGGGSVNRFDKRQVFWNGLEFELDWKTGKHRVKNLLQSPRDPHPGLRTPMPIRYKGRQYLVSSPSQVGSRVGTGFVYLYEKQRLRLVAAMGYGASFSRLKQDDMQVLFKRKTPKDFGFTFTDLNGDGQVQPSEVKLRPLAEAHEITAFSHDFTAATLDGKEWYAKELLDNGTPVFDVRPVPAFAAHKKVTGMRKLINGNYFVKLHREDGVWNAVIDTKGKVLWRYHIKKDGMEGLFVMGYEPGEIVHQFMVCGNEVIPESDIGEVFVIPGNAGQWNMWTADGLLASQIYLHKANPEATGRGDKAVRDMRVDPRSMGQEHFCAYFTRSLDDGRVLLVSGFNNITISEIRGLDRFKRLQGVIDVTPEMLQKARAWDQQQAAGQVFASAPHYECIQASGLVAANEKDRLPLEAVEERSNGRGATFKMTHTPTHLHVSYNVTKYGPMKNIGNDWRTFFKSGACVFLDMGRDPKAPDNRRRAAKGDFRVLMSMVNGEPRAVLYDSLCANAGENEKWHISTPGGGEARFDRVVELTDVKIKHRKLVSKWDGEYGYQLDASIPLKAIGLKITPDLRLKFDWGFLITRDGSDTVLYKFWSNKTMSGTTDAPSEARLKPNLWGHVTFVAEKKAAATGPRMTGPKDEDDGEGIEDLLEGLGE